MGKVSHWIAKTLLIYASAFFVFYSIGFGLELVPQPVVDGVGWTAENFSTIVFLLCFGMGTLVALKILSSRRN